VCLFAPLLQCISSFYRDSSTEISLKEEIIYRIGAKHALEFGTINQIFSGNIRERDSEGKDEGYEGSKMQRM